MNPLLQNNKPSYPSLVSDKGDSWNRSLTAVVDTTIVVPTGTNQTDALPLLPGRNIILSAAVGTGVIITAPFYLVPSVYNLSGRSIACYPPLGGNFYQTATNIPISIPSGGSLNQFVTADGILFFALTNGSINFSGLPTSDAGLVAGALWNNGNYVCLATGL